MKGLLLNAKNHGFALKMIYMTDQGVITERFITVKDFMDELESDVMPVELKKYIKTIEKEINEGRWDYKRPPNMKKYPPNF